MTPARLLTQPEAVAELTGFLRGRQDYLLQQPASTDRWLTLDTIPHSTYVLVHQSVVVVTSPAQMHALAANLASPACAVSVVAKSQRSAFFAAVGAEDADEDLDVLITDLTDDGPNPLLEAALAAADAADADEQP